MLLDLLWAINRFPLELVSTEQLVYTANCTTNRQQIGVMELGLYQ